MATLSEYFETEARDVLNRLEQAFGQAPLPDAAELHRAARALRGTAQMAREDRVFRTATALESAMRAYAANAIAWSEDLAGRAQETLADLRVLVAAEEDEDSLESRADAAVGRWGGMAETSAPRAGGSAEDERREFRAYAADEVSGIAEALEEGVQQLAASPMDREPLKMILRRQRALLGAARLDEIPVVAEILRAIEDLTRVIAKLDVGVKQEWLDIYRVARDGLQNTVESLREDENPEPSHSLSRLRHMREELLERYGAGEAVSAAHEGGLVQARSVEEPPAPEQFRAPEPEPVPAAVQAEPADEFGDEGEDLLLLTDEHVVEEAPAEEADDAPDLMAAVRGAMQRANGGAAPAAEDADVATETETEEEAVPIESLLYRGDAALERAQELRSKIEQIAAHDPSAREAVEELFDLIRLAREA